jgi:hypothetical protein
MEEGLDSAWFDVRRENIGLEEYVFNVGSQGQVIEQYKDLKAPFSSRFIKKNEGLNLKGDDFEKIGVKKVNGDIYGYLTLVKLGFKEMMLSVVDQGKYLDFLVSYMLVSRNWDKEVVKTLLKNLCDFLVEINEKYGLLEPYTAEDYLFGGTK